MIGRGLPPISQRTRELLTQERLRPAEDPTLKRRLLERARETLAHDRPSGVALRLTAVGSRYLRQPRALLLGAAAVVVAGLAAAGAGVYRWSAVKSTPQHLLLPSATAFVPTTAPKLPTAVPANTLAARNAESAAARPRVASSAQVPPATSLQTYALEASLLEPARRGIAAGDYPPALAALARHMREFPRGQLAEERDALRVRALWGMGQKFHAETAAATFRKRYPRSMLLGWMKTSAAPGP